VQWRRGLAVRWGFECWCEGVLKQRVGVESHLQQIQDKKVWARAETGDDPQNHESVRVDERRPCCCFSQQTLDQWTGRHWCNNQVGRDSILVLRSDGRLGEGRPSGWACCDDEWGYQETWYLCKVLQENHWQEEACWEEVGQGWGEWWGVWRTWERGSKWGNDKRKEWIRESFGSLKT
jgi:hypothetical protein